VAPLNLQNHQLESLIAVPMETFTKQEIDEVKEKRKKLNRFTSNYESALSKASQIKKIPSLKTLEVLRNNGGSNLCGNSTHVR
jgi:hypothetical protein